MKKFYLSIIFPTILLVNSISIAAMQPEAYSQRISRGLQTAREFAQRYKGKLIATAIVAGAIAAALAGTIGVAKKLQSNVIKIYARNGFDMAGIKKQNRIDFERLVGLGIQVYTQRFGPLDAIARRTAVAGIINALKKHPQLSYLPEDYPNLAAALKDMLDVQDEESSEEEASA